MFSLIERFLCQDSMFCGELIYLYQKSKLTRVWELTQGSSVQFFHRIDLRHDYAHSRLSPPLAMHKTGQ
jgi:hypothetical protein